MIQVAKDDILRGLKKFKRLAKQDILASPLTSNPNFWSTQAEARRKTYDELMQAVERNGIEEAYELALRNYAKLPVVHSDGETYPEVRGERQALEMFFVILGVDRADLRLNEEQSRSSVPLLHWTETPTAQTTP
ncbi:MAG: hypothetical protein M1379_06280 [Firmicutes bacterium]|nr:hypothetical protein [Bacillota bacterium]